LVNKKQASPAKEKPVSKNATQNELISMPIDRRS